MKFQKLAEYFQKLESTASRNKMTEILSELFSEAKPEEADKICYLSLGRLAPKFAGIEFNLAEKLMIKALAQSFDVSGEVVKKAFKKSGDLGEVAYKLKVQSAPRCAPCFAKAWLRDGKKLWRRAKKLKVSEVYEKLYEIATEAGEGSVKRKVNKMARLIRELDPTPAKYIVRIPLGKLRLGFSDMTILDALSWMISGDKSKRDKIEEIYNVRADVGQIAKIIKTKGLRGLRGLKVSLGTPIVPALCQRLPTAEEMIEKMALRQAFDGELSRTAQGKGKVAVEPKYDGLRCISGSTALYVYGRGFVLPDSIKKGDLLLTHRGEFKPVLASNKRVIDKGEELFRLQTYLGNEFKITEGHKVLVFSQGEFTWKPVEEISKKDWLAFPRPNLRNSRNPPSSLNLVNKAGYQKKISLTADFYRFLGFWIGDGFTNNFHNNQRVGIIFNAKKEEKLAKFYKKIVTDVLRIREISESERQGALTLYWRDDLFRQWLSKEFRINFHGKTLPSWFANISKKQFEAFFQGWLEADGTSRHSGGYKLVTKENKLASFGQLLALQFGKIVGLRKEGIKIPGKNYSWTYCNLIIPGTSKWASWHKGKLLVKILRKERFKPDPRMVVYNFQVDGDESYCTSIASLHNCQIHAELSKKEKQVKIFTRNLENVTQMFPDIVEALAKEVKAKTVVLDGEAIGIDTKTGKFLAFQETIKRKRKYQIKEMVKEIPLKFFCFDILYKNGQDLLKTPFNKRRLILEKTLSFKNRTIVISPQIITDDPQVVRDYHDEQIKKGLEGAVLKKWHAPYDPGRRGYTWVKFKQEKGKKGGGLTDTLDCVVMGYYRGKGKRAKFGIGAFLVGIRKDEKFLTISKIGTGLSDEQWRELKVKSEKLKVKSKQEEYLVDKNLAPDVWIMPGLVVEIEADNVTKSPIHTAKYALRFPRLVRFRDDKSADQATTIKEVEKLYKLQ